MIFKCNKCIYITNIKCNLKRHCVRKHNCEYNDEEPEAQKVATEQQNVNMEAQNVSIEAQNVSMEAQNVSIEDQNIDTYPTTISSGNVSCIKCNKILSSQKNLNRHLKTCKGVTDKLECHLCHKFFATSSTKSRHLKKCVNVTPQIIDNSQHVSIVNNNNNITNNTVNNNINTNNNTFIVFNINDSNPIEFSDKHLDNPSILQKIFSKEDFAQILSDYSHRIFEKPENRIIKKTNMRSYNSDVYIPEENSWAPMLDCDIYFKIARGISSSALVLTDKNNVDIEPMYKDNLQQIQVDCEISPDKGFEDPEMKYSRTTRKGIQIIKNVVNSVTPRK